MWQTFPWMLIMLKFMHRFFKSRNCKFYWSILLEQKRKIEKVLIDGFFDVFFILLYIQPLHGLKRCFQKSNHIFYSKLFCVENGQNMMKVISCFVLQLKTILKVALLLMWATYESRNERKRLISHKHVLLL